MNKKLEAFENVPDEMLTDIGNNISEKTARTEANEGNEGSIFETAKGAEIGTGQDEAENEPTGKEKKSTAQLGAMLSGKFAVKLIDIAIPVIIVFAIQKIGYVADKRQWKLTPTEKEVLEPAVQDVLDTIDINFDNPYYMLAFVVCFVYGSKIVEALPEMKRIDKRTLKQKVEEINVTAKDSLSTSPELQYEEAFGQLLKDTIAEKKIGKKKAVQWLLDFSSLKIRELKKSFGLPENYKGELEKKYSEDDTNLSV